MTEPDPVALAVEAALTPSLADAAAEVDAWARAQAADAPAGHDVTLLGLNGTRLRLRSLRVLTAHAYATGEPCGSERAPAGPPDLLAYTWGESVTWTTGRILVPLNAGDQTTADMELDEAGALLLADMLKDAAAREAEA